MVIDFTNCYLLVKATVIPILKTPVSKRELSKMGHFVKPCFHCSEPHVVDLWNFVLNDFTPPYEVQGIGNVALQSIWFQKGSFQNGLLGCLWALSSIGHQGVIDLLL